MKIASRIGLCLLLGLSSALVIVYHMGIWAFSPAGLGVLLLLTVLAGLTVNECLRLECIARFFQYSVLVRRRWVLFCLLAGAGLALVLPVRISVSVPARRHVLEITATGEKNPLSRSSEVWVIRLTKGDGSVIQAVDLDLDDAWEVRDGVPISYKEYKNQPAHLHWSGLMWGNLKTEFLGHYHSGVVVVRWDGKEQRVDLYDPSTTHDKIREVVLPGYVGSQGEQLLWSAVLYGAHVVVFAALFMLVGIFFLEKIRLPERIAPVSRWSFLYYALPCALIWGIYLMAFWPGIMTYDSFVQWGQLLTVGKHDLASDPAFQEMIMIVRQSMHHPGYTDYHPAFHTMTIWLVTRLCQTPAMMAVAQITALSLLAGWGFALTRRLGAPCWLVWTACLLFAFSPIQCAFVITLWKDIPYGIAVLAMTLLVVRIVMTDGAWLKGKSACFWLAASIVLASLYRHNGFAAWGVPIVLTLFYRQYWRRLTVVLISALVFWAAVKGPLYYAAGVLRNSEGDGRILKVFPLVQGTAAHVKAGTPLTSEEREYLDRIYPIKSDWDYNPPAIRTGFAEDFNWEIIIRDPARLLRLYLTLTWRNPRVTAAHFAVQDCMLWRITQPVENYQINTSTCYHNNGRPFLTIPPNIDEFLHQPELKTLRTCPKWPDLTPYLTNYVVNSQQGLWTIWQPAAYLYLLLAGAFIAAVRTSRWKIMLITTPVLLHTLLLAVAWVTPNLRYQYPVILVASVLWPAFWASRFMNDSDSQQTENKTV